MNPSLLISVHSIWATRIDSSPSWRSCSPINPTLNSPSTTTHHWIAVNVPMLPTWWVHFRFLIYIWQIIILKRSADDAWKPFESMVPAFQDFRDASYGQCNYKCTVYIYSNHRKILHCLRGLEYAIKLKWFDVRNFNLRDYEFYERVENGDLNWTIPDKFVSFSGPSPTAKDTDGVLSYHHFQMRTLTPEDYVPIFKQFGVQLVIRLNKKAYEGNRFTKSGIKHEEIYFLDGSTPSDVPSISLF